MKQSMRWTRIFAVNFILFISVIIIAEFVLRFEYPVPEKVFHFDENYIIWSNTLASWRFKSGSESEMSNGIFREKIIIDNEGFRSDESIEGQKSDSRLVNKNPYAIVIGDSQSFGHGLASSETYSSIINKLIEDEFGSSIFLRNFSMPGTGPFEYNAALDYLIVRYSPRLIIIGLTDNDLCEATTEKYHLSQKKKEMILNNRWSSYTSFFSNPKKYIYYRTSIGLLLQSALTRLKSFFVSKATPVLDPSFEKCNESILAFVQRFTKKLTERKIKAIFVSIPNGSRVIATAIDSELHSQLALRQIISNLEDASATENYIFVDPMSNLVDHFITHEYLRESIILPVDSHNNGLSNKVIAQTIIASGAMQ